jgi:hypothetical protein
MQVAACFLVLFAGSSALAQSSNQTQTLASGGADQGILLAPDIKFTELDGDFANLAGIYGGWLIDNKLLLGGGGYYLTNGSDDLKMAYGGFVVEYFLNANRLVNFSVKGLVGGGNATVSPFRGDFRRLAEHVPFNITPTLQQLGNRFGFRGDYRFPNLERLPIPILDDPIEESFFIAEPEANVYLNLTETFTLGFGGGYRFIGAAGRLNQRLDGFTAKAALKITL